MTDKHIDDVSGVSTTGHEWDGIRELDNPMPRWWLWTFYATILFAIGYTIAYPAWPLISSSTAGLTQWSSRGALQDAPGNGPAELDLARDAYRAALRIDPLLHGARYNLELLERLAPVHAGAGWRRNTDPVSIQSDRHNGWTTIRESEKRGLP